MHLPSGWKPYAKIDADTVVGWVGTCGLTQSVFEIWCEHGKVQCELTWNLLTTLVRNFHEPKKLNIRVLWDQPGPYYWEGTYVWNFFAQSPQSNRDGSMVPNRHRHSLTSRRRGVFATYHVHNHTHWGSHSLQSFTHALAWIVNFPSLFCHLTVSKYIKSWCGQPEGIVSSSFLGNVDSGFLRLEPWTFSSKNHHDFCHPLLWESCERLSPWESWPRILLQDLHAPMSRYLDE